MTSSTSTYYADKAAVLADVFGAQQVDVDRHSILVDGRRFPVVDDVIVLLEPSGYTRRVLHAIETAPVPAAQAAGQFASDIQFTFGQEWKAHPAILAEHEEEFRQYFDLTRAVPGDGCPPRSLREFPLGWRCARLGPK